MTVGMVAAAQGHIHILQFLFDEKGLDPSEQKNVSPLSLCCLLLIAALDRTLDRPH